MPLTAPMYSALLLVRQASDLQASATALSNVDLMWGIILLVYVGIIAASFLPTLRAYLSKVPNIKLTMPEEQIISKTLPPDELEQVRKNFRDMAGALRYWKKQVAQAKFLHFYSLVWTTIGTILVPLLLPYVRDSGYVQTLITLISLHTAILLAFNRLLKPDRMFQSFRQIESGYYDLLRDMLDRPYVISQKAGGDTKRLDYFIDTVKQFRLDARRMETAEYFPSLDTSVAAQAVQQVAAPIGGVSATAAAASVSVAQEQSVTRAQIAVVQQPATQYLPQNLPQSYSPTVVQGYVSAPQQPPAENVYSPAGDTVVTISTTTDSNTPVSGVTLPSDAAAPEGGYMPPDDASTPTEGYLPPNDAAAPEGGYMPPSDASTSTEGYLPPNDPAMPEGGFMPPSSDESQASPAGGA